QSGRSFYCTERGEFYRKPDAYGSDMKTIGKILSRVILAVGFALVLLLSIPTGALILLTLFVRHGSRRLSNFIAGKS
ncbi:MAG: hypothetical protein K2N29_05945, partial [Ruminiclostridium sp.]|nr:hypothetical protein [Ruminiclostridium sp.]